MSVINQMLQDLEKRRAGAAEGSALPNQVRPLPAQTDAVPRNAALLGAAALVALAAGAAWWTMRTLPPPPPAAVAATPALAPPAAPTPPAIVAAPPPSAAAPAHTSAPPAARIAAAAPAAAPVSQPKQTAEARAIRDKIARDSLRLSSSLTLPAEKGTGRSAASATLAKAEPTVRAEPVRSEPSLKAQPDPSPGSIDRQARPTNAGERAETEYRRASGILNQGRAAEAADALRAALAEDPAHDGARQTLVGLLIEQRRLDEAQKLVQDALAARPNNPGFAMILARLQVDRGDSAGALSTLAATSPYASESPDFQGFYAALLQRAGRHQEAAEQYHSALRYKPDAGVWWMGLGISQQALERGTDALEAYRRALSSNTLSPELQAFVEQRIRQLAP